MDIVEAIKTRKSVRKFKKDSITRDVLRDVLEIAGSAPSAMNTQPWEFFVISGDVIENIKKGNIEKLNSGETPNPEHPLIGWPSDSVYKKRQVGLAKQIFQIMDIQREDKKKRGEWLERGFRFFDAPAAIIIVVDRIHSESGESIDIGSIMQTICLAALKYDLGTCIEDQGVMFPQVVREFADIPDSKRIIISIAIGYPDWDFPANKLETPRESLDDITTWCGFD